MNTCDLGKKHLYEQLHFSFLLENILKFIPSAMQTKACNDNTNLIQVVL